jgi:hypothetical protein
MYRITSFVAAFCLALLLPAQADAQRFVSQTSGGTDLSTRLSGRPIAAATYAAVPAAPTAIVPAAVQSCRVDTAPDTEPQDSRWQWRLRAFRHLDCVTTLIDHALVESGAGEASRRIQVSRDELERIRTLAWWARDAAARIGH